MKDMAVPEPYAYTSASAYQVRTTVELLAGVRGDFAAGSGLEDLDRGIVLLREAADLLEAAAEAYWKAMEAELPPGVDL